MKKSKNIFVVVGVLLLFPFGAFSQDWDTSGNVSVSGEDIYKSPIPDFTKALEGKLPGLVFCNI